MRNTSAANLAPRPVVPHHLLNLLPQPRESKRSVRRDHHARLRPERPRDLPRRWWDAAAALRRQPTRFRRQRAGRALKHVAATAASPRRSLPVRGHRIHTYLRPRRHVCRAEREAQVRVRIAVAAGARLGRVHKLGAEHDRRALFVHVALDFAAPVALIEPAALSQPARASGLARLWNPRANYCSTGVRRACAARSLLREVSRSGVQIACGVQRAARVWRRRTALPGARRRRAGSCPSRRSRACPRRGPSTGKINCAAAKDGGLNPSEDAVA
eukprot:3724942-Prymnesium_polylepis.2